MIATHCWEDKRTWSEAEGFLDDIGMAFDDLYRWKVGRRHALSELKNRLRHGGTFGLLADRNGISGEDAVGEWRYCPGGGLRPVDFSELRSVLSDPIDLDQVCRGVLESCLVHDGHSPQYAEWATYQLPWCYQQDGEPFAPHVVDVGWQNSAQQLAPLILAEQEKRKARTADRQRLVPAAENASFAEGPVPTRGRRSDEFKWRGTSYPLRPQCFRLVSKLWVVPERSLSLRDALVAAWDLPRGAEISKSRIAMVRTCASGFNDALDGTSVRIAVKRSWDRDHLTREVRVTLITP